SEVYTQLDNYLAMLNNDISRIPAQKDIQPVAQSDSSEIKVEVNSSLVRGDVAPIIINGRTMVPIRFVAEALDCLVDWRGTDNTVIITPKGADKVDPPVTDKSLKIYVSSKLIIPDVPPRIVDGRTLVPIRFVAEALNADVSWDGALRKVIIKTK
ncbi:MAG TPA: copper amine oxidase N-terminal domain-containing protein, partial [Bacillota bacterium]|nr:copper amine oxidase N-terminal domain-containing protein [Bacillota bacterium]